MACPFLRAVVRLCRGWKSEAVCPGRGLRAIRGSPRSFAPGLGNRFSGRFQGQQGEELVLREVLSRELGGLGWDGFASKAQNFLGDRPRRFGHGSCSSHGT
jgi:hypothetical protein